MSDVTAALSHALQFVAAPARIWGHASHQSSVKNENYSVHCCISLLRHTPSRCVPTPSRSPPHYKRTSKDARENVPDARRACFSAASTLQPPAARLVVAVPITCSPATTTAAAFLVQGTAKETDYRIVDHLDRIMPACWHLAFCDDACFE